VGDFSGSVHAWRFAEVDDHPAAVSPGTKPSDTVPSQWVGPRLQDWTSSLDRREYMAGVEAIRDAVRAGAVYQATLCRVLQAPLDGGPGTAEPSARELASVLAAGNPAPYAFGVHVPASSGLPPVWVVSASPELYLRLDGDVVTSGPIKGTATTPGGLSPKDEAENVMITDLVRNDLQRVCVPGTVEVIDLLALEHHPGLVHLVSTVQGRLTAEVAGAPDLWARLLEATYPPGSVSGAPKLSALSIIDLLEPTDRGPYCGAVGWIDADAGRAELAVGIRTFWWTGPTATAPGMLRFGTGAGITWGSDAAAEWEETELKARRLVALASGVAPDDGEEWQS
jgi:para-aminobenzoate synthetase component 1